MFMVDSSYRNHSLRWKLITRAINVKKLAIVYSTIPVWFGDRGGGGWGQRRAKSLLPHPYPFPYFWQATALLVQISFSPQPSADIKKNMAATIFGQEILSTRSPKLRLLCRLLKPCLFPAACPVSQKCFQSIFQSLLFLLRILTCVLSLQFVVMKYRLSEANQSNLPFTLIAFVEENEDSKYVLHVLLCFLLICKTLSW